jgi:hypothetical protein
LSYFVRSVRRFRDRKLSGLCAFSWWYLGHPWGSSGAAANRVALEACTQARNEGRDLAREGGDVIRSLQMESRTSSL